MVTADARMLLVSVGRGWGGVHSVIQHPLMCWSMHNNNLGISAADFEIH